MQQLFFLNVKNILFESGCKCKKFIPNKTNKSFDEHHVFNQLIQNE